VKGTGRKKGTKAPPGRACTNGPTGVSSWSLSNISIYIGRETLC